MLAIGIYTPKVSLKKEENDQPKIIWDLLFSVETILWHLYGPLKWPSAPNTCKVQDWTKHHREIDSEYFRRDTKPNGFFGSDFQDRYSQAPEDPWNPWPYFALCCGKNCSSFLQIPFFMKFWCKSVLPILAPEPSWCQLSASREHPESPSNHSVPRSPWTHRLADSTPQRWYLVLGYGWCPKS